MQLIKIFQNNKQKAKETTMISHHDASWEIAGATIFFHTLGLHCVISQTYILLTSTNSLYIQDILIIQSGYMIEMCHFNLVPNCFVNKICLNQELPMMHYVYFIINYINID